MSRPDNPNDDDQSQQDQELLHDPTAERLLVFPVWQFPVMSHAFEAPSLAT